MGVIGVVTEGDEIVKKLADYVIEIPATDHVLMPIVSVVPLQLLSYHIAAVVRGNNVDQPRNLAKSVTVAVVSIFLLPKVYWNRFSANKNSFVFEIS